ncbi:family 3 adenylate cyclase [Nitzschia inconspicua]|uniref:Family 3 adenylate cyclase n=1 Tax=Nitzschia inconspicua TaxID=303405 RepID=A0A9K3PEB1_9STRA|nr:family 3 adenylate cyclase [Nitzschia inconspicua]
MDLASHPVVADLLWDSCVKKVKDYSRVIDLEFLMGEAANDGHIVIDPIFDDFHEDAEVVGFMLATLNWDRIFDNVLFDSVAPVMVEIHANCSAGFSYLLTGEGPTFLGPGINWHGKKFDSLTVSKGILTPMESREGYPPVVHSHRPTDAYHNLSHCTYSMNTYPTVEFEQSYHTTQPIWFTTMIASIFLCTAMVFLVYDILVQKRQKKLMSSAKRSNAIVSSLFPKEVQEKLMNQVDGENAGNMRHGRRGAMVDFLDEANPKDTDVVPSGSPIADIFTDATVMFADIAGFTAWSSTRVPSQVFVLLESIYAAFDAFARKRKVFKVETIGDCYVPVTGVPHPHINHAVLMAKFSRDCMGTELGIRIGLNSGPVTAGVLRGDSARFQLFGDTGELLTYWLKNGRYLNGTVELPHDTHQIQAKSCSEQEALRHKHARLVKWISDILATFLKQIIAKRKKQEGVNGVSLRMPESGIGQTDSLCNGGILEEVQDLIKLPKFDPRTCVAKGEAEALDPAIATELYQFIGTIESMYCTNPFHSFEYAAHVTMSVMKLLSRIVAPETDPNFRVLMNENSKFSALYNNKSIAEQKSVDDAWQLLMRPTFENLRGAIYSNTDEYNRFRQLVVNCVMATDIVDKDLRELPLSLNILSKHQMLCTLCNSGMSTLNGMRDCSRRCSMHTRKEMFNAYQKGRRDTNPADNCYEGEIAFFDYYIIPLAKKLHECGVFGVFSDEYLTYALKNRREWEQKGNSVVSEMLSTIAKKSQPSLE